MDYKQKVAFADANAKTLYEQDKSRCVEYLTEFSCNTGEQLVKEWKKLYGQLFAKYMDGATRTIVEGEPMPKVSYNAAPEWYYRAIIEDMGDKQRVKEVKP